MRVRAQSQTACCVWGSLFIVNFFAPVLPVVVNVVAFCAVAGKLASPAGKPVKARDTLGVKILALVNCKCP